jgi:hypothetical protein
VLVGAFPVQVLGLVGVRVGQEAGGATVACDAADAELWPCRLWPQTGALLDCGPVECGPARLWPVGCDCRLSPVDWSPVTGDLN